MHELLAAHTRPRPDENPWPNRTTASTSSRTALEPRRSARDRRRRPRGARDRQGLPGRRRIRTRRDPHLRALPPVQPPAAHQGVPARRVGPGGPPNSGPKPGTGRTASSCGSRPSSSPWTANGPRSRPTPASGLSYDACVLATGSEPVRIPVPGADDPEVLVMRTLENSARLQGAGRRGRPGRRRRQRVYRVRGRGLPLAAGGRA